MSSLSEDAFPTTIEPLPFDRSGTLLATRGGQSGRSRRTLSSRVLRKFSRAVTVPFSSASTSSIGSVSTGSQRSGLLRGIFGQGLSRRLLSERRTPKTVQFNLNNNNNESRNEDGGIYDSRCSIASIEPDLSRRESKRRSNVNTAQLTLGIEEESAQYLDLVQKFRVQDWLASFRRTDPRFQIMRFFDDVAQEGSEMLLRKSGYLNPNMVSPLLKAFRRTGVFSVWRPTSKESIKKMILGHGTGKGLDIKGKSAKIGKLSAFVPFLQIHDETHKNKVRTLPKNGSIRVFYKKKVARDKAKETLELISEKMTQDVATAKSFLEDASNSDDELEEQAMRALLLDFDYKTITLIDDYGPGCYGLVVAKRVFWEAYVMKQDISRAPGSMFDTGRPSIPAFQDMNFSSIKQYDENHPCPNDKPRAVVWQYADPYSNPNEPDPDPMLPQTLLMAYEENGRVLPVVSDFDCFLIGTRAVKFCDPIPKDQIELVNWTIDETEKILESPVSDKGWTSKWLEVMKDTKAKSHHIKMPTYGFGDPMSYSIMAHSVQRLNDTGAVRHGAECFNYYFPQDLDDEFLVVSESFLDKNMQSEEYGMIPWRYLNQIQLQEFLDSQIDKGFTFPLNPKWILCDKGWKKIYDKLLACNRPNVKQSLNAWLPRGSGIRERIEAVAAKYPDGFKVLEEQTSSPQKKSKGTQSMDLAELEIQRYLTLQRAKRKLRAIMFWISLGQKAKRRREALELLQQQNGDSKDPVNDDTQDSEKGNVTEKLKVPIEQMKQNIKKEDVDSQCDNTTTDNHCDQTEGIQ